MDDRNGVAIHHETAMLAASLRYFTDSEPYHAAITQIAGLPMPLPLGFSIPQSPVTASSSMLVWRSPTESLLLSADPQRFLDLEHQLAGLEGGCLVNQTGGLRVLRLHGRNAWNLLARLGSTSSIPAPGAALSGRFAEVLVLIVCPRRDEYLLVVERVYVEHLLGWIDATAADLT